MTVQICIILEHLAEERAILQNSSNLDWFASSNRMLQRIMRKNGLG